MTRRECHWGGCHCLGKDTTHLHLHLIIHSFIYRNCFIFTSPNPHIKFISYNSRSLYLFVLCFPDRTKSCVLFLITFEKEKKNQADAEMTVYRYYNVSDDTKSHEITQCFPRRLGRLNGNTDCRSLLTEMQLDVEWSFCYHHFFKKM